MPIPRTQLHKERVAGQIMFNINSLLSNIPDNAAIHKSWATASTPPFIGYIQDCMNRCATDYLRRLKWCTDLRAIPVKKQRLLDVLTVKGYTENDIINIVSQLKTIATDLLNAPKDSYAQIITACDNVITAINMIPRTNVQKGEEVNQMKSDLHTVQLEAYQNGTSWLTSAMAQSPTPTIINSFITPKIAAWNTTFQKLINVRNNPTLKQDMLDMLAKDGYTEDDVMLMFTPLRQAIIDFNNASKTTFAEIITACNALLTQVTPPDSLWTE